MTEKTLNTNSKLHADIMKSYENENFLTGKPERVLKVGFLNKKTTFISFKTINGVENFYNYGFDGLYSAIKESEMIINFEVEKVGA